jgi:uncharacterized protein
MRIWVDADACPKFMKEILFRAAERAAIRTVLVANRMLHTPPSPWISAVQVPGGFDVADHHIVRYAEAGDLVVTADIPLAAAVIDKGGHALNPRGTLYSKDNIRELLSLRDFMTGLRDSGVQTGGPAAISHGDRQKFSGQLDRFLARRTTSPGAVTG